MLPLPAVAVGTAGIGAFATVIELLPAVKLHVAGVAVLTVNVDDTPPIVKVVDVAVFAVLEDVTLTLTVWLFVIVPFALTKVPLLIEYAPPLLIDIGAAAFIPAIVTELEMVAVERATLFAAVNVNAFGVVSVTASVVNVKKSLTILISKLAFAP